MPTSLYRSGSSRCSLRRSVLLNTSKVKSPSYCLPSTMAIFSVCVCKLGASLYRSRASMPLSRFTPHPLDSAPTIITISNRHLVGLAASANRRALIVDANSVSPSYRPSACRQCGESRASLCFHLTVQATRRVLRRARGRHLAGTFGYSAPRVASGRLSSKFQVGAIKRLSRSEPAPAPLVQRVKPGQCQERCHVPDVKHPPAGDAEGSRPEALREVHHHIHGVAQPAHDIGPAGDDHPPVSPPLQLDEAVRRYQPGREKAEDAEELPALFAWSGGAAHP